MLGQEKALLTHGVEHRQTVKADMLSHVTCTQVTSGKHAHQLPHMHECLQQAGGGAAAAHSRSVFNSCPFWVTATT